MVNIVCILDTDAQQDIDWMTEIQQIKRKISVYLLESEVKSDSEQSNIPKLNFAPPPFLFSLKFESGCGTTYY